MINDEDLNQQWLGVWEGANKPNDNQNWNFKLKVGLTSNQAVNANLSAVYKGPPKISIAGFLLGYIWGSMKAQEGKNSLNEALNHEGFCNLCGEC